MKKIYAVLSLVFLGALCGNVFAESPYLDRELNEAVPNAKVLAVGIIGGGQPDAEGLKVVREQKFTTVVDLRTAEEGTAEEMKQVQDLGMVYVNIPMADRSVQPEQIESLQKVLSDKNSYPVLMHCRSGGRVEALWKEYQKAK